MIEELNYRLGYAAGLQAIFDAFDLFETIAKEGKHA